MCLGADDYASIDRDVAWADGSFDCVVAMAGLSPTQASDLVRLAQGTPYYVNGCPGFNLGEAKRQEAWLLAGGGLVEDASAAAVFTTEQQQTYMTILPPLAASVAMRSRVTFPLTARGSTGDGCGPYGRQFRDAHDQPTRRSVGWYADLTAAYGAALDASARGSKGRGASATPAADRAARAEAAAAMRRLAAALGALPSRASLDRVLACCADHVNASVIDTLRDHASVLYPLLVAADRQVGVVATKIYDAKLTLSTIARHAAAHGVAPLAAFGLADDGSATNDAELMRELLLTLMSLHLPAAASGGASALSSASGGVRYRSRTHAGAIDALLGVLAASRLPPLSELYLCDTGVDPNEDDLAAILVRINVNLLIDGRLEGVACGVGKAGASSDEAACRAGEKQARPRRRASSAARSRASPARGPR